MEQNLIVLGLQKLAQLLDRLLPMQGARTMLVAVLAIVANLSLFLMGKETAQEAANVIALSIGIVLASLHKPPTTPPTPPLAPS